MKLWKTLAAALTATLMVAGCAQGTDEPEQTDEPEETVEDESDGPSEEPDEPVDEPAEEEPVEEDVPFDPAQTVLFSDVEVSAMGSDESEALMADAPGADMVAVPHNVNSVVWDRSEQWVSDRGHSTEGYIQMQVPGADRDDLIAFATDQAAEFGWELVDGRDDMWTMEVPLESGPADIQNADLPGWVADVTKTVQIADSQDPIWYTVKLNVDPRFTG